ncbi:MAG: hypothetical protein KAW12_16470 [Candidatus Aminicenantes bacterium]|nr:hypothetical protein [Candidatus Aminicenantes bacterium]
MKKFLMTFLAVFVIIQNAFCLIIFNESPIAYNDPDDIETIDFLVREAAGYFLISQSDMALFSHKVELSQTDELLTVLNRAIENMEKAKQKYSLIIETAQQANYNQDVIKKLLSFDYQNHQETNDLLPSIFAHVEAILKKGDLNGSYIEFVSYIDAILNKLYVIKDSIDNRSALKMNDIWQANFQYSEALIYGQIVTGIFTKIK